MCVRRMCAQVRIPVIHRLRNALRLHDRPVECARMRVRACVRKCQTVARPKIKKNNQWNLIVLSGTKSPRPTCACARSTNTHVGLREGMQAWTHKHEPGQAVHAEWRMLSGGTVVKEMIMK